MSHRQHKVVSDELQLMNNPGVMVSMSDQDFNSPTNDSSNHPTFNITARSMPTVTSARTTVKTTDPLSIKSQEKLKNVISNTKMKRENLRLPGRHLGD